MKKILYTASTDIHLINFHVPYIKLLSEKGYEVHVACNGENKIPYVAKQYKVIFKRSPFEMDNLKAYNSLKKLIKKNQYILIHCHTPTCSVITRLAARKSRAKGTKVIYTAHGFHFYNGASLKNWILFYPAEILLSYITDAIITMNKEDFNRLSSPVFKSKNKYVVNGIGVNPERLEFDDNDLVSLKQELQIQKNDVIILYIAEFIPRKNHKFIFDQLKEIVKLNQRIKFLFVGGFASEKEKLEKKVIKDGISNHIKFLGYRKDIGKIISLADIGVSSSIAEGLPIGVLELMHNKIPLVASNIRGHNDIIADGENGYLFDFNQANKFKNKILMLSENVKFRKKLGEKSKKSIQKFLLSNVIGKMAGIYNDYIN